MTFEVRDPWFGVAETGEAGRTTAPGACWEENPLLEVGDLTLETRLTDDVARLRVAGELDVYTADNLLEAVERVVAEHPAAIRIDGTALTFVDSAGIRALVVGLVLATESGIGYEVSDASAPLDRVLSITGLAEALGR
jgi:anti-anti-sigma factor